MTNSQSVRVFALTFLLVKRTLQLQQSCVDKGTDCPKSVGLCSVPVYRPLMAAQCPVTCGLCSATATIASSPSCRDWGTDCPRVAYLCENVHCQYIHYLYHANDSHDAHDADDTYHTYHTNYSYHTNDNLRLLLGGGTASRIF